MRTTVGKVHPEESWISVLTALISATQPEIREESHLEPHVIRYGLFTLDQGHFKEKKSVTTLAWN